MKLGIAWASALLVAVRAPGGEPVKPVTYTNSIGMKMVQIEAGSFQRGSGEGEFDEKPVHKVTISRPFGLGSTEVTNAQYEQFDPEHRKLRGKLGFSKDDDEAVVFVSWEDAVAFCQWLGKKEGEPYRLPTEAEWEYACRAGTTTPYHTGDKLPKAFHENVKNSWFPSSRGNGEVVPLHVGKAPPNPWGLMDMHGNVEEWCLDWYGPYAEGEQTDPVGRADGDFRVTRGGSHSTTLEYLRSANRMGTLPEDKHWLTGFRVACGEMPQTKPLPPLQTARWARDVKQEKADWSKGPDMSKPYFKGPIPYVKIPPGSDGPLYSRHNHCPALVGCPNGDLLAIWYTTRGEPDRVLAVAASRLRRGRDEWEQADLFWDAPDRNDHASALFVDDDGTLFHFNGLGAGGTWGGLASIMRTSTDNGATWSKARLIMPEHGLHHMPIESVFKTKEGDIIVPCDAVTGGNGGSAMLISHDGGKMWTDPGEGRPQPKFEKGATGAWIAGIHAGVVQLKDGRLLALGRSDTIDGHMPMSISTDMGKTWTYRPSPFPPIGGGQRLVLTRLTEGPIFLASFSKRMTFTDAAGNEHVGSGLFAALSYDEGETWDIRRPITPGGPAQRVDGGGNTGMFAMSSASAEPRGYMSVHQTPGNVIHLISSKQYYAFNLAWLKASPPAPPPPPKPDELRKKARLDRVFHADRLPSQAGWRFNGTRADEGEAVKIQHGALHVRTGPGQRVRWVGDGRNALGGGCPEKGHTVEITMKVTRSTDRSRGIDLETFVPGIGRAFITVTASAVLWYDGSFHPLAESLDNAAALYTYRLAVDGGGNVQVFRDGKLLGARRTTRQADTAAGARGAYVQWGEGAGASEADAVVAAVACDPSGAYAPEASQ
ncbi:MAG TPA: SUMF1/EgtB/PvdO family nonheme iron enzyme [Planctomycetota bacterium]|nr:SUMF1/EgtB/PvdO family nonheme iron enzyme [Planctomycetota bacterium]